MTVSYQGRRAKGNKAENEVRDYLRDQVGEHIARGRGEGAEDRGDIAGLPMVACQVKNYVDIARAVNEGLKGVAVQKANAKAEWGAVWVRRRGGEFFVAMTADDWVSMYREATIGK
jgi:hypothetical protein